MLCLFSLSIGLLRKPHPRSQRASWRHLISVWNLNLVQVVLLLLLLTLSQGPEGDYFSIEAAGGRWRGLSTRGLLPSGSVAVDRKRGTLG